MNNPKDRDVGMISVHDLEYLRYLLRYERDTLLVTYLEQKFQEPSWNYQLKLMIESPYFANKILDDYEISNEEKQQVYLKNLMYGDSKGGKIVLVDGAKGGGKTGFGAWTLDECYKMKPNLKYYYVSSASNRPKLPEWITIVRSDGELPNDCVALIDEGAIQLSSRRAMTKENTDASDRLVVLRHKGITLIILVQDIKMIDTNVRRLADIRILKFGIPFGAEKGHHDEEIQMIRTRLQPMNNREAYMEIPSRKIFFTFSHSLPNWWDDEKVSKSFRDVDVNRKREEKGSKLSKKDVY